MELSVEYLPVGALKPYSRNNRKHSPKDVEKIAESIQNFGFNDPIGVWGADNIIVEGHGRLLAAKRLKMKNVPVIRLDHLTDEQRREYAIEHNRTAELSEWDFENLKLEADELGLDLDIAFPEIEIDTENAADDDGVDEAWRTTDAYNLGEYDETDIDGWFQMPKLSKCHFIPEDLIGFNYVMTSNEYSSGVHFYIDDYQFERIWNRPEFYLEKCSEFSCILTPDFSLYTEMPRAMKIWNTYRSRLIGQIAQRMGMKVIPTVSWCEPETFKFCFDGLPKDSVLSISTIGVKRDEANFTLWKQGVDEMLARLTPKALLLYGGMVDYDFGKTKLVTYENHVTERMKDND